LKRVLILVEGYTEERFVKRVLIPEFSEHELYFYPTILVTKRVKDGSSFKGGVTNYAKFKNDVTRLLRAAATPSSRRCSTTTACLGIFPVWTLDRIALQRPGCLT